MIRHTICHRLPNCCGMVKGYQISQLVSNRRPLRFWPHVSASGSHSHHQHAFISCARRLSLPKVFRLRHPQSPQPETATIADHSSAATLPSLFNLKTGLKQHGSVCDGSLWAERIFCRPASFPCTAFMQGPGQLCARGKAHDESFTCLLPLWQLLQQLG